MVPHAFDSVKKTIGSLLLHLEPVCYRRAAMGPRSAVPTLSLGFVRGAASAATLSTSARVGALLVGAFVLAGALEPLLTTRVLGADCRDLPKVEDAPLPPGRGHWLGTDQEGRDLRVQILCGARTSLIVGVGAELLAAALGIAIGGWAGFKGGRVDAALMHGTDIVLAFPFPLVAVAVVALTEQRGAGPLVLLLGLLGWPSIARLVRSRVLAVSRLEFIAAARAAGADDVRILTRHALPAGITPVWAAAAAGIAGNILAEAWLSFIGLADGSRTSWGTILHGARGYVTDAWWFALFPGLAITFTILGFILLGEGLREALDPRVRSATR
jgi:peptide/nickel transport system permease protein